MHNLNNVEGKLSARLLKIAPEWVVFELTVIDPTIAGEMILPYPQFLDFLKAQNVSLIIESEDHRIRWMELSSALQTRNLPLPS